MEDEKLKKLKSNFALKMDRNINRIAAPTLEGHYSSVKSLHDVNQGEDGPRLS